jgi:hypothetical protein
MGAPHRHLPPRPRPETAGGGGGGAGCKRELQRRQRATRSSKAPQRGLGSPPGPHGGRFQAILGHREADWHLGKGSGAEGLKSPRIACPPPGKRL